MELQTSQSTDLARCKCSECTLSGKAVFADYKSRDPKIAIVGEAPGAEEDASGIPFSGKSGKLLRQVLESLEITDVVITNTVLCRPTENRKPTAHETACCSDRLRHEVSTADRVLLLGDSAVQSIADYVPDVRGRKISELRGKYFTGTDGREYLCSYHPAYILRNPGKYQDFVRDVAKLRVDARSRKWPQLRNADVDVCVIDDDSSERGEEMFLHMLRDTRHPYISTDIETSFLRDPSSGEILCIGFGYQSESDGRLKALIYDWYHVPWLYAEELLEGRAEHGVFQCVGHNLCGFEYSALKHHRGIELDSIIDTMLAHYSIDERSGGEEEVFKTGSSSYHGLKLLLEQYFDMPDYAAEVKQYVEKGVGGFERVPRDLLYGYLALDVAGTLALALELIDEMEEEGTRWLHDNILVPGAVALSQVEKRGVLIDVPYLAGLESDFNQRIDERIQKLIVDYGAPADLNINSPKQVSAFVYDQLRLPEGRYGRSTGADVLDDLYARTRHPALIALKEVRSFAKIRGTYIVGLLKKVGPDGRLYTSFIVFGTATGRLSSRAPNLQNIPAMMGPEIRRAFVATPGYVILDADHSQLELRVAALESLDPILVDIFKNGYDIHSEVAVRVFQKPADQITRKERDVAKCLNFGIAYGRGKESVAEDADVGLIRKYLDMGYDGKTAYKKALIDAQDYINEYMHRFPVLTKWIEQQHAKVLDPGYVVAKSGRRRRFDYVDDYSLADFERHAVNSPIQGFASDICLMGLTHLEAILPPDECRIILTVHDSIVLECREDLVDKYKPIITETMESVVHYFPGVEFPFPLKAEIKEGPNWGDVK